MTHPTPQPQAQRDLVRKARIALSRVITRDTLSRDALAEAVQLLESALASPAPPQVSEENMRKAAIRVTNAYREYRAHGTLPAAAAYQALVNSIIALESALSAQPARQDVTETKSEEIARLQNEIGQRQFRLQMLVCGDPRQRVSMPAQSLAARPDGGKDA